MICYIDEKTYQQLSLSDPLNHSGLSPRVCNALANESIHTYQDLLRTSRQKLANIQGLGPKGFTELLDFLHHLWSHPVGQRVYPLTEKKAEILGLDLSVDVDPSREKALSPKLRNTPLEDLTLSVRAYNSLHKAGYRTLGDVFKLSRKDLLQIRNLGTGTANEITAVIDQYIETHSGHKRSQRTPAGSAASACHSFMRGIFLNATIHDMNLYRDILREFQQAEEQGRPVNYAMLYEKEPFRDAVCDKITHSLEPFPFGLDIDILYQTLPAAFKLPRDSFAGILREMVQTGVLRIRDPDKISIRRMSILDLAPMIQDERLKDMLNKRLTGIPLKVIASEHRVSKERVRQIVLSGIRKFDLELEEDKYIPIFEQYVFTKDEFMRAFGEPAETFHYLTIVCNKTRRLPISKFTQDPTLPEEISQGIQSLFLPDCLCINGETIEHNRVSLTKYIVRHHFSDDISFEELVETYKKALKQYGLEHDPKLAMNRQSYINHLRRADFLLWKPGYTLRYYDINSRNYGELLNTLQLDRYQDVEYSARKFFLAEPALMQKYDIRDEHELHNLLRKICEKDPIKGIQFLRTPNISFGNSDRYQQVYQVLREHSPMTQREFLVKYGELYGIDPDHTNPVFYLEPFRDYRRDGIYDLRDGSDTGKGAKAPFL